MRRLLTLLIATLTALGMSLAGPPSASALGTGEWLGCRIAPGTEFNFYNPCYNTGGPNSNGQYGVAFMVQAESAPSTYSWAIPAVYQSKIYTGCTSASNSCTLLITDRNVEFSVSVTLTQGSATETLTASANISSCPYC